MKLSSLFPRKMSWASWLMLVLLLVIGWQVSSNFARGKQLSQLLEGAETMGESTPPAEPKKNFWSGGGGWGQGGESASASPASYDSGSSSSGPSLFGRSSFSNQPQDVDDVLMQLTSIITRDKSKLNLPTAKAKYEEMLVKVDDYLVLQGLIAATQVKDMSFEKATSTFGDLATARMSLGGVLGSVRKM